MQKMLFCWIFRLSFCLFIYLFLWHWLLLINWINWINEIEFLKFTTTATRKQDKRKQCFSLILMRRIQFETNWKARFRFFLSFSRNFKDIEMSLIVIITICFCSVYSSTSFQSEVISKLNCLVSSNMHYNAKINRLLRNS